jgi:hypothetical protein
MYILQDLNDKIIFLAIACKKSDARVYIALQRIDWKCGYNVHVSCDILEIDYKGWVKRLTRL